MTATRTKFPPPLSRFRLAFSVVELLVAVSVLTLIVLVLYGVFDQVQKALRGNVAQVDTLEGGRTAMEMMTRELEQMRASGRSGGTNLFAGLVALPTVQEMLEPGVYRTNILQEIFFTVPNGKEWSGIGYKVYLTNYGVGSLYRFSMTTNAGLLTATNLSLAYMNFGWPKYSNVCQRVTDGIVHFRVRPFATNGYAMMWPTNYPGVSLTYNGAVRDTVGYSFTGSALPAYLDVELGILEPQVLERYKSFVSPTVASNYLAKQTGKVRLFQQRIPIRNAP